MGYYQDRDFEEYLDYELTTSNCNKKCQWCGNFYNCFTVIDTTEIKDYYHVVYAGMYLMSHKKNGKWFTKDIKKARKFKKVETAKRHMIYMNIPRYNIV